MSSEFRASENPRKWRFTWEAQSHIPALKLLVFYSNFNPSTHCKNLKVQLCVEQSLLTLSWFEDEAEISLRVPIPRVLVDAESPVQYIARDDHVEVKLVLLLPVDHPILTNYGSVLSLSEDECYGENVDDSTPLWMDSDVKILSSTGGVQFYCRSCSTELTGSLRIFAEMPSSNWREVADNWFGACCCSFGGASEKLVDRYAKSYATVMGVCLLSSTFIVLCKDDLVGCTFPTSNKSQDYESEADFSGKNCSIEDIVDNGNNSVEVVCSDNQKSCTPHFNRDLNCSDPKEANLALNLECHVPEGVVDGENLPCTFHALEFSEGVVSSHECCLERTSLVLGDDCLLETSGASLKEQKPATNSSLLPNQKSLLNGFLGDIFMARSSSLSKDVQWIEFLCPKCSCFLGAYPSDNGHVPLDGGVRLFKCYISTCLPVGGPNDLFRKYTLERMSANQLLGNAKDELSFRTVVRDLQTRSAMLQIVLLNTNSWHCSGYCLGTDSASEPVGKVDLLPAIKVLFLDCCNGTESHSRMTEEWVAKNQVDEVYMFLSQVKELIKCLQSAKDVFPFSCAVLEGLQLSSMRR